MKLPLGHPFRIREEKFWLVYSEAKGTARCFTGFHLSWVGERNGGEERQLLEGPHGCGEPMEVGETLLLISCVSCWHLTALYLFLGTSQTNLWLHCVPLESTPCPPRTCHPFFHFLVWSPLISTVKGQPFSEEMYLSLRYCYTERMINANYP